MLDLIFKRYGGNAKSIFNMPFFDGMELYREAESAEFEQKLFMRWINGYQFSMRFDDFKELLTEKNKEKEDTRTGEEILSHIEKLMEGF